MKSQNCSQSLAEPHLSSFPRINCAFHPSETITNFCACEECLLPLCPSCIKIHTIEHVNFKKVNPVYEPINDLMEQICEEVQQLIEKYNENYKKVIEMDARVNTFKTAIQQKIFMVKNDLVAELERSFAKLAEDTEKRINSMNYVQHLNKYKDSTKKIIIGLKNVERCFVPDNSKIMRTIIKYKGAAIKQELQNFGEGISDFMQQVNSNFATFSVREDFRQALHEYLSGIKKIQIHDVKGLPQIEDVSTKLKEAYEKSSEEQKGRKKQIRKSIGDLLINAESRIHQMEETEENKDVKKESSSQQIQFSKPAIQTNENRRKSLSRGKGLSVMQVNTLLYSSTKKGMGKAVNINHPADFNKTAFIRRPGMI